MTLDRGTQGLGMHLEDNGEPSPLNRAIVTGMAAGKPAKESGKIEAQDVLVGIDGRDAVLAMEVHVAMKRNPAHWTEKRLRLITNDQTSALGSGLGSEEES